MRGPLWNSLAHNKKLLQDMADEIIAILDWWWWPFRESNSPKPIIQYQKTLKRQQRSGIEKGNPTSMNNTYLRAESEILLLFSVFIIIIIITMYISIICYNCMQFPHPLVGHKFDSEQVVILCVLYLLLDRYEKGDQLFAAQCIWWLPSIFQFTEILIYYRCYKIFPSDYIKDCVVSTLEQPSEPYVPDSKISKLQLDSNNMLVINRRTRTRRIVKPVNVSNKELLKRYPG